MNPNSTDKEALARAVKLYRAQSPARAKQVDEMLRDDPWQEVPEFCAYACENRLLRLQPWQDPPCIASLDNLTKPHGDQRGERESAAPIARCRFIALRARSTCRD
jgi:hypothetical protein